MAEVLRTENITKSFPGVLAVDDVSLVLESGEILALVGENGAGKSTLTQILGGAQKPDSGRILLEGRPLAFNSSADAMQAGISMVFQELSLVGSLSVAENIFANRQPVGRINNIHWKALYREAADFLKQFELDLDPRMLVKRLSMGQQQILEILKAISINPKVLILDEPTSSLTESEIAYLFQNIRKLQKRGMSFIYITHKLSEIFQIASRVIVMRDGRYIGSRQVDEVTENDLVSMMVGRQISNLYGDLTESAPGKEFFQVKDFRRGAKFEGISFSLRGGEILGLAGLVGAGRTEVGRAIFGVDRRDGGEIWLDGVRLKIENPLDAIHQGIAYLTEDRKGWGLFLGMSLRENLIAPTLRRFTTRLDILNRPLIDRYAQQGIQTYDIQTSSIYKKVLHLSGGTQQKCLVAMWMGIDPKVLICDEPTRGVDVGARAEIYRKLREFAAQGVGIILISSDLPELIGMCDRVLVMHAGKIVGEVPRNMYSEEIILSFAAGINDRTRGRNGVAFQGV